MADTCRITVNKISKFSYYAIHFTHTAIKTSQFTWFIVLTQLNEGPILARVNTFAFYCTFVMDGCASVHLLCSLKSKCHFSFYGILPHSFFFSTLLFYSPMTVAARARTKCDEVKKKIVFFPYKRWWRELAQASLEKLIMSLIFYPPPHPPAIDFP